MSHHEWGHLRKRVAGKWQAPLFVFSLGLIGYAWWGARPEPPLFSAADALAEIDSDLAASLHGAALQKAESLLENAECDKACRGAASLRMARIHAGRAARADFKSDVVDRAIGAYERAQSLGQELTAEDFETVGRLHESQGRLPAALGAYEQAAGFPPSASFGLIKRIVTIARRLELPAEHFRDHLDSALASVSPEHPERLLWVLEQELDLLEESGNLGDAHPLLQQHVDRFSGDRLELRYRYLQAWVAFKNRQYQQAEGMLRAIRNQTQLGDELHGMSGWLLGRVILDAGQGRAEEALAFFDDVIRFHRSGSYVLASRIGRGEALLTLNRVPEAIDSYVQATDAALDDAELAAAYGEILRASLSIHAESLAVAGDLRSAVALVELAGRLIDPADPQRAAPILLQSARLEGELADQVEAELKKEVQGLSDDEVKSQEAVELRRRAAANYLSLSRLPLNDDRRAADSRWEAAELYALAGDLDRAIELLREFAATWPEHAWIPRVSLRIGQLLRQAGQIQAATEALRECYRRYPNTLDGGRALIPLAEGYIAMGPDQFELAGKTLELILEDSDIFTPQAPEFCDALLLRGRLELRQEKFERAISTLTEWLDRFPEDPRAGQAKFFLADAYRQSGLKIRSELGDQAATIGAEVVHSESRHRLFQARRLFGEIVDASAGEVERHRSPLERVQARHARLYEADCLFECGQYDEAAKLYEEAADAMRNHRDALVAMMQAVHCHIFAGKFEEARTTLGRAELALSAMADSAFSASIVPDSRQSWSEFFEWLAKSDLF